MKLLIFSFIAVLLLSNVSLSQQKWEYKLSDEAIAKTIDIQGNLLLVTPQGISNINNEDGTVKWTVNVKTLENVQNISRSILAMAYGKKQYIIFNVKTGEVLYNKLESEHEQNKIQKIANKNLLVIGSGANSIDFITISMITGKILAKNKVNTPKLSNCYDTWVSKQCVAVLSKYNITKFNADATEVLWKSEIKPSAAATDLLDYMQPTRTFLGGDDKQSLKFLSNGMFYIINSKNGTIESSSDLHNVTCLAYLRNDRELLIGIPGKKECDLKVFDFNSGKEIKSKTLNVPNLVSFVEVNKGIVALGNTRIGGAKTFLIDPNSLELIQDKIIKTGGTYYSKFIKRKNTLFMMDPYSLQAYDANTFERLNSPSAYTLRESDLDESDQVAFYSNNKIGIFNFSDFKENILSKKDIKLKYLDKESLDTIVQTVPDGYVVESAQHVVKIDKNGNEVYNVFYPAPGAGFGSILVNTLGALSSATLSTNREVTSKDKPYYDQLTQQFGEGIRKRYNNNSKVGNYKLFVTKIDGKFKILKFNKDSGKVDNELVINSRNPDYLYDPLSTHIYTFDNKSVVCYTY